MERLTVSIDGVAWFKTEQLNVEPCEMSNTQTGMSLRRLAAIEDILGDEYDLDHLSELIHAEKDRRLVVLPAKASGKLYAVGEKLIIECEICEVYLDDKNGIEYLVSFDCADSCDGCPFNNWKQDFEGEFFCDGEYGQATIFGSDFGKTVFLTRKKAEDALKEVKDNA